MTQKVSWRQISVRGRTDEEKQTLLLATFLSPGSTKAFMPDGSEVDRNSLIDWTGSGALILVTCPTGYNEVGDWQHPDGFVAREIVTDDPNRFEEPEDVDA
jgi:hypothetical protein